MSVRFDYDFVFDYIVSFGFSLLSDEYINTHTKLLIKCPKGHEFTMAFNNFKKGQRCPICARINQNRVPNKPNNKKHSNEYIQTIVEERGYKLLEPYINKRTKLKLECPNGHYHEIRLDSFQNGSGCKQCMKDKMMNDKTIVIEKLKNMGYKPLNEYTGNKNKMKFLCINGHEFETTYDNIMSGYGNCPICNSSSGEQRISIFLINNNIYFITQYRFNDCKYQHTLPFDFYLPELKIAIEYDGELHYKPIEHFGGDLRFQEYQIRDEVKTKYCKDKGIYLIRIPYWNKDDIEEILENELNKHE